MDFEEMKVIWDSQNDEPLYAINQAALRESINRKARGFKKLVLFFEFVMLASSFGGGIAFLIAPLAYGYNYHQIASGVIFLMVSIYFFTSIRKRLAQEASFEASLLGDLDKSLWQVKNHIARSRALKLGFILPCCIAIIIDFAFEMSPSRIIFLVAFLVVLGLATWGIEKEIKCLYAPKERKLESLRELLLESK